MTSVQKFENPVIALAGKKAADIADALTQQMILMRLIPKNTKPEDVLRDKTRRGEQKNVQHSAI